MRDWSRSAAIMVLGDLTQNSHVAARSLTFLNKLIHQRFQRDRVFVSGGVSIVKFSVSSHSEAARSIERTKTGATFCTCGCRFPPTDPKRVLQWRACCEDRD